MKVKASTSLIFIQIPEELDPEDRETRYGEPLDAALRVAAVGFVSGGGTLYDAPDEDGERDIIFSGVDADVYDIDTGRALLRTELIALDCPADTKLEFARADGHWHDVFDGTGWRLAVRPFSIQ